MKQEYENFFGQYCFSPDLLQFDNRSGTGFHKIQVHLPYDFQLAYLKDDKSILIDVREFFEYRKSRIKNAVNIPSSGNLEFSADTLDKENSLFLYCTSGFRSKRVAKYFCEKGFNKVYNLEGGITAWEKDGMQVEKKRITTKNE